MADPIMDQIDEQTEFLWQDEEGIRDALFADAQASLPQITNYNPGGIFRTILEIVTRAVHSFYVLLANVCYQHFAQTARAGWLDLKAEEIGITRKPATQTAGNVHFYRETPETSNVVIPAGAIVSTATDSQGREYRFLVTAETILESGETEVAVPVVAESAGAEYNVGTLTINRLITTISGVDGVENRTGWLTDEGTDQETDTELRERYRLKWEELARGSTKLAYVGYAKEINGVVDVLVDDTWPRGPGTVDIYITGTNGLPTQALIDEVQANIDDKKPICSDALVKAPSAVVIDAAITIYVVTGTTGQADIQVDAVSIINALFIRDDTWAVEDLRFKLGQDVTQDRIILALGRHIEDIKRVDCGFSMIAIQTGQMAAKGTISVTVSEEAE